MITPASFRIDLPEFADTQKYPNSMISYWIAIAVMMLPTSSWGMGSQSPANPPTTIYDFGCEQFVAHNLVLEAQAMAASTNGGVPGSGGNGIVTSESVGSVSRSYDASAGLNLDGADWNLTLYGVRFLRIARMRGRGPVQIGPPQGLAGYGVSVGGWYGPPVDGNGNGYQ